MNTEAFSIAHNLIVIKHIDNELCSNITLQRVVGRLKFKKCSSHNIPLAALRTNSEHTDQREV